MLKLETRIVGFDESEELIRNKLKKILMKSMFKMEELAVRNAPHDQGELREKITVIPQTLSNVYVLLSRAKHSEATEYGTRPFYAPISPLIGWAERKLGDPNLAYAVRAKIAKVGITAQPYIRPALLEVDTYWKFEYAKQEFSEFSGI